MKENVKIRLKRRRENNILKEGQATINGHPFSKHSFGYLLKNIAQVTCLQNIEHLLDLQSFNEKYSLSLQTMGLTSNDAAAMAHRELVKYTNFIDVQIPSLSISDPSDIGIMRRSSKVEDEICELHMHEILDVTIHQENSSILLYGLYYLIGYTDKYLILQDHFKSNDEQLKKMATIDMNNIIIIDMNDIGYDDEKYTYNIKRKYVINNIYSDDLDMKNKTIERLD